MNSTTTTLTPASQQALAEAALVLQHAQGFVYLPMLVQSERAGALAMEYLRPALTAELFRVPWPLPQAHSDDPVVTEQRVQDDLQAVLDALDDATRRLPAGVVLLLDASSSLRCAVARRLPVFLNQRREDWRRLGQGLLLLWPQSERDALMQGAPDLWSVRAAAPWVDEQDAAAPMLPLPVAPLPGSTQAAPALGPTQQRQWRELQAVEHWADADLSAADVLALLVAMVKNQQTGSGLALAERLLNTPDFRAQPLDWQASVLAELALLRRQAGDLYGALAPAQEAVEIRRALSNVNAQAYEVDLARSLNNLSTILSETGDQEAALVTAQESVDIRRRMSDLNPGTHRRALATSLNNLSHRLDKFGDRERALSSAREAVSIYRELARYQPESFDPDLAMGLHTLALRQSEAGERQGALARAREAVSIYRRLAKASPAIYEADLGKSLNNLANRLFETGDLVGALAVAQEGVSLYRRLAAVQPSVHEPVLAGVLTNQAQMLSQTGDWGGALLASQDAVTVYNRLARANPILFEPSLANSLWMAMRCLVATGQPSLARTYGRESLRLFARLAEREPARFEPYQQAVQAELDQLDQA